ncbi:hypothetical protein GR927_52370, partial [Mycolicibacterium sp. 3033]|nr:hypothetical protein [Mycolicibacterium aurantiacum]
MIVTDDSTFTGDLPNVKMDVPNVAMIGGNPITVTTAAPGTSDATPASSTNDTDRPRGRPPSVVENVTALSA